MKQALTYQTALDNFLAYPTAQGTENLKTTNISGRLTLTNDLIINGDNYIQFPDGTQQNTAPNTSSFASVNSSNTFLSQHQPANPYQQIITGNNLSSNTNSPLVVKNIDTGEYCGFYIDPSTNYDVTLYSAQTSGGLTIRNSDGSNSFSITPTAPNNTAYISNPLSCGTFPLTSGAITSSGSITGTGNLKIQNSTYSSTLSVGSANTLNINTDVVTTGNISAGNSSYISSGSAVIGGTTFSSTSGTFGATTNISVPTQPAYNSSTTYGNVLSTQAFVKSALVASIPQTVNGLTFTIPNTNLSSISTTAVSSSSPTFTTISVSFYFTPTANISAFTMNFNKAYYQGTFSATQPSSTIMINNSNNSQIGMKQSFPSNTSITNTGVGTQPIFVAGTSYFYDFSVNILTT